MRALYAYGLVAGLPLRILEPKWPLMTRLCA